MIVVYTDGGCTGNPGGGGWAAVVLINGEETKLSGGERETTNNRMELRAAIEALNWVNQNHPGEEVELHTDSQYVNKGLNEWMTNWKRNNWLTAAKKPVKNKDFWIELDKINGQMSVKWNWVKGHAGDKYNEMCDFLVAQERMKWDY